MKTKNCINFRIGLLLLFVIAMGNTISAQYHCSPLHNPRHMFSGTGLLGFVDSEGKLWIESPFTVEMTEVLNPFSPPATRLNVPTPVPMRLLHPHHGTPQEPEFEKILAINRWPLAIVAQDTEGNAWAYYSQFIGNTTADHANHGDIFCKNCPNNTEDKVPSSAEISPGVSGGPGWGLLTGPDDERIVDVAIIENMIHLLDENGDIWFTREHVIFWGPASTNTPWRFAGVGPNGYIRGTTDQSYQKLTIPGNDSIVEIESYDIIQNMTSASASPHLYGVARGKSGKVYWWGGHDSRVGKEHSPTEAPFPAASAGVTAIDIQKYITGVWIHGSDNKLYSIGLISSPGNLTGDYTGISVSNTHYHIIQEVTGWPSGVNLDLIVPGNAGAQSGAAFVGDGELYISWGLNPAANTNYVRQDDNSMPYIRKYADWGIANMDLSSGVKAFYDGSGFGNPIYLQTNDVLGKAYSRQRFTANGSGAFYLEAHATIFPDMDVIHNCHPWTSQSPLYHAQRFNGQPLSAPPSGGGPANVGSGGNLAANPIDCSQTQIVGSLVEGTPSEVGLRIELDVTTAGAIAITVDSSGMSLKTDPYDVSTQTTGPNIFNIPLVYDGSDLGTFYFTVDGQTACSADLSTLGNIPMTTVNYVTDLGSGCTPVTPAVMSNQ